MKINQTTLWILAAVAATGATLSAQEHRHGGRMSGEMPQKKMFHERSRTPAVSDAKAGSHGGDLQMTKEFQVEVALHRDSVRVYLHDHSNAPVGTESVHGSVRVVFEDRECAPIEVMLRHRAASDKSRAHGERPRSRGDRSGPCRPG